MSHSLGCRLIVCNLAIWFLFCFLLKVLFKCPGGLLGCRETMCGFPGLPKSSEKPTATSESDKNLCACVINYI